MVAFQNGFKYRNFNLHMLNGNSIFRYTNYLHPYLFKNPIYIMKFLADYMF